MFELLRGDMMKRQVFFSFHYENDVWRTSKIRNMGVVEGQALFSDNGWEKVRKQSDQAIKRWIDKEMNMRSCLVVLIGEHTSERKWIKYEIEQAWKKGKGIVGIYIHNLKDHNGEQSKKGSNPLNDFYVDRTFNYIAKSPTPIDDNDINLGCVCKAYDSTYSWSQNVYNYIKENIADWIEEAITIRNKYPK